MQEKMLIFLNANNLTHPSWAVMNVDNTVRQSAEYDHPEGLAHIAEGKEIVVVVPAFDVLLAITKLPKMNRTRLMQAVPYALEEQLIAEVDTLHFALGEQVDEELPVAVVAKERMQSWLALLQSWHIKPDVLIPASFLLPYQENTWHIVLSPNEDMVVRTGKFSGFACDKNNLNELLDIALTASTQLPMLIHLHNYTHQTIASLLTLPTTIKEDVIPAGQFIKDLAMHRDETSTINLLQATYAVKKSRLPKLVKVWKWTAYLAVAWVLLLFFYPTISYFILKQRINHIDDQVALIYKKNFPQANGIVAPKLRIQEKLQKLTTQMGENHLLLLMGYVGKGMTKVQSIKLKRLDFQNEQLTLELTAGTSEDFSAFTDFLTKQGLTVKQQNANLAGSRINATLLIE